MKSFYKELVFGVSILIVLNLIVYRIIIYPEVYEPYKEVMNGNINNKIIFSDSHGWALTRNNPEGKKLLEKNGFTNLSYGSDSYFDIYFKLNYLINRNNEIDTIFLTADPHMFGESRMASNNRNRSIEYVSYDIYNEFFPMSKPEFFFRKYLREYLSAFDVNNSKLIQNFLDSKFSLLDNDEVLNWEHLTDTKKQDKSLYRFKNFYKNGPSLKHKKALNKIYEICELNNITIVLVQYPSAPLLEELKIPYEFNEKFYDLNYNSYKIIRFQELTDKYFRDQDHVNKVGAMYIIKELINLNNQD